MFDISVEEVQLLISPAGQKLLFEFIERAKRERGAGWIVELKKEFPRFTQIFDLVCNRTEAEALAELKKEYPLLKLGLFDNQLIEMHRKLKFEIERER